MNNVGLVSRTFLASVWPLICREINSDLRGTQDNSDSKYHLLVGLLFRRNEALYPYVEGLF